MLGACLGAQILCEAVGGQVRRMETPEIGWVEVEVTPEAAGDPLIGPMEPGFTGFNWHSYECLPPSGAAVLAKSAGCIQSYRVGDSVWGIQFHAEVSAADANQWIDDWREDEDAVRIGLDPDALRVETEPADRGLERGRPRALRPLPGRRRGQGLRRTSRSDACDSCAVARLSAMGAEDRRRGWPCTCCAWGC